MSRHTPGPWRVVKALDTWMVASCGDGLMIQSPPAHGDSLGSAEADATLIAAAPELLTEPKLANKIIMNALNSMTSEQKLEWDRLNARDGLKDGWALTRNNAREAVIAKAEGRDK